MNCQTEKEQKKEIKKRDSTWIPVDKTIQEPTNFKRIAICYSINTHGEKCQKGTYPISKVHIHKYSTSTL